MSEFHYVTIRDYVHSSRTTFLRDFIANLWIHVYVYDISSSVIHMSVSINGKKLSWDHVPLMTKKKKKNISKESNSGSLFCLQTRKTSKIIPRLWNWHVSDMGKTFLMSSPAGDLLRKTHQRQRESTSWWIKNLTQRPWEIIQDVPVERRTIFKRRISCDTGAIDRCHDARFWTLKVNISCGNFCLKSSPRDCRMRNATARASIDPEISVQLNVQNKRGPARTSEDWRRNLMRKHLSEVFCPEGHNLPTLLWQVQTPSKWLSDIIGSWTWCPHFWVQTVGALSHRFHISPWRSCLLSRLRIQQ